MSVIYVFETKNRNRENILMDSRTDPNSEFYIIDPIDNNRYGPLTINFLKHSLSFLTYVTHDFENIGFGIRPNILNDCSEILFFDNLSSVTNKNRIISYLLLISEEYTKNRNYNKVKKQLKELISNLE